MQKIKVRLNYIEINLLEDAASEELKVALGKEGFKELSRLVRLANIKIDKNLVLLSAEDHEELTMFFPLANSRTALQYFERLAIFAKEKKLKEFLIATSVESK